jgi:hypothetical protein
LAKEPIHPQVLELEMSELCTNPKKPKLKEEDEEEEANVSCREEQEEVLVALVEHRSNEIERLNNHISNYQTKVSLSLFKVLIFLCFYFAFLDLFKVQ